MTLLNVEELQLPERNTDHAVTHRTTAATDVHDIRALTTTGKITLPPRRPQTRVGDRRSDD